MRRTSACLMKMTPNWAGSLSIVFWSATSRRKRGLDPEPDIVTTRSLPFTMSFTLSPVLRSNCLARWRSARNPAPAPAGG